MDALGRSLLYFGIHAVSNNYRLGSPCYSYHDYEINPHPSDAPSFLALPSGLPNEHALLSFKLSLKF
jgi:hypothetical protein